MLSTMAGAALLASLVLGARAGMGWQAYHQAKISRAELINRGLLAMGGLGSTAFLYIAGRVTGF